MKEGAPAAFLGTVFKPHIINAVQTNLDLPTTGESRARPGAVVAAQQSDSSQHVNGAKVSPERQTPREGCGRTPRSDHGDAGCSKGVATVSP